MDSETTVLVEDLNLPALAKEVDQGVEVSWEKVWVEVPVSKVLYKVTRRSRSDKS